MLQTLKNAWKIPELKQKLLFVVLIVVLYRFGSQVPVPFIDATVLSNFMANNAAGSLFAYLNILSGEAFSRATLFALSVSPYITASIVMQLLTIAIPALEKIAKEGEEGRKKIDRYTRWVTVGLGLLTAYGYYAYMKNTVGAVTEFGSTVLGGIVIVACYGAGAALLMWLCDKIEQYGIGNGISIILFFSIVSTGFSTAETIFNQYKAGGWNILFATLSIVIGIAIITFVVFFTNSERRLPVQYAKRVVGRKMYGGQSSNLPIKLNMAGVMPIIFAQSIVALPQTLYLIFPSKTNSGWWYNFVTKYCTATSWLYILVFAILIIAFSYFYIAITFDPIEVSNNLKKNGGFIPGIRPGKPTADYIRKTLNRITLIGGIFLLFVSVFPMIINACLRNQLGALAFGGSSLLIVVGVALETAREIEAQMTMRHYKGFLE